MTYMKTWGIDISRWQKGLELSGFQHCTFAIIKAGGSDDGLYIDSQFKNFYDQAKALGWPVGIYWYTRAVTVTNLLYEIDYLIDHIKGLQFELPIFLDLEETILYNNASTLAAYWLNTLPERGYYPGIYSSLSWWKDTLRTVACDPVQKWLALWGDYDDPGYDCGIWQDGHITFQDMEIDSDYMFADYSFIKEKGLNGFMADKKDSFKDVNKSMSCYKAAEWGAKKGIIKGYSDGTFRPDQPVTRGQVITMLWREAGRPEP